MNIHIKSMTETDPKVEEKRIISELKSKLREGKEVITCTPDEIAYIKKPIGKSIYKYAVEEKQQRKKKYVSDERVSCDICGKEYRRSNKSIHEKTHYHLTYKLVNDKLKQLILN